MLSWMKLYRNQEAPEGGIPVAPAAPAAPAASPAPSEAPAPAAPAPAAAAPAAAPAASAPAAAAPAAPAARVIDTLPAMHTPGFKSAYLFLSDEDRKKVDTEVTEMQAGRTPKQGEAPAAEAPAPAQTPEEIAAAAAAAGESAPEPLGETEITSEELDALESSAEAVTPEVLATLPESVQKALAASKRLAAGFRFLDGQNEKFSFFAKPETQASLKEIFSDPIIKDQIDRKRGGKGHLAPAEVVASFSPTEFVTPDSLKEVGEVIAAVLGEDDEGNPKAPDAAKLESAIASIAKKAFEAGVKKADMHAIAREQFAVSQEKFKYTFENALVKAAEKYPAFKATDPNLSVWDAAHPLKKVIDFATEKKLSHLFTSGSRDPGGTLMAAYLAETGALQEAMKNAGANARTSLIRQIEKSQRDQASTVGRATSMAPAPQTIAIPGDAVDMVRFNNDPGYRTKLRNEAYIDNNRERITALAAAEQELYRPKTV